MKGLLTLTIFTIVAAVSSCQTTSLSTPGIPATSTSASTVRERYQQMALHEVLERTDALIQSGIRYYNSGHVQDAMIQFIEAHRLIERYESTVPIVRGRLHRVRRYLEKIYARNSSAVFSRVRSLIDSGTEVLNLKMLESAEAILNSIKRWRPELRNDVESLMRRVRTAKREVRRELRR